MNNILFFFILFFLFLNIQKIKLNKTFCRYNKKEYGNSKICKIPCYLKINITFPSQPYSLCTDSKLYQLKRRVVTFFEPIKLIEYWFEKSELLSRVKYFNVLMNYIL